MNLEDLTSRLLDAANLEEAFHLIKNINYLGDFYAYQIVCDMVEIGLLGFRCESFKPPLTFTPSILVKTHGLALDQVPAMVSRR